jgi:D-alanyl-D-alanine endopeptidase (penicillin-binding protein 7)
VKRTLCIFSCILAILLVAKLEWNNWPRIFQGVSGLYSGSSGKLPLQKVHLNQKALESDRLRLKSEAAVVLDIKKEEVLFTKNMEEQLPIASLSKLMSILVFLECHPDPDGFATITEKDAEKSGLADLRVGETLALGDLLHACLMNSSNRAARALARASGLAPTDFVSRMNRKARELGLKNTFFCEPTGLSEENRSTALDCAKLLYFALQDSVVASISGKTFHRFVSLDRTKRVHEIRSTNRLLFRSRNVKGGKTGYNGASGWCLGVMVEGEEGEEVVAVVLGAPDKRSRYEDIRSVVEWCMQAEKKPVRKS